MSWFLVHISLYIFFLFDYLRYDERKASSHLKKREDDGDFNLAQRIVRDRKYSISGQADDEYDFDGAPARKHKKKREVAAEEKHSFGKRILTQQERCQFCFENPSQPKHLVVSIANFTYMMLPRYQPLVQGHCCILPLQVRSPPACLPSVLPVFC